MHGDLALVFVCREVCGCLRLNFKLRQGWLK